MSASIDAMNESAPLRFTFVADWQALDPAEGGSWRPEPAGVRRAS